MPAVTEFPIPPSPTDYNLTVPWALRDWANLLFQGVPPRGPGSYMCISTLTRVGLVSGVLALTACGGGGASPSSSTFPTAGTSAGSMTQANRLPTISGAPATSVTVDVGYAFTPVASDPDNDRLSFTIQNRPAWADFDPATGRLSGVPRVADLGRTAPISISVTDGSTSAALASFVIDVVLPAGSALLTWVAPQSKTDGSLLTDLAGYRLYYGTDSRNFSNRIEILDAKARTHLVNGLSAGTWYFSISATDSAGAESARSSPVSLLVP